MNGAPGVLLNHKRMTAKACVEESPREDISVSV